MRYLFSALVVITVVSTLGAQQQRVALNGHQPRWARAENDAGPVPRDTAIPGLRVYLKRPPEREAALQALMQRQLDPASPDYHRWLTPEQLGRQFGPSPAVISITEDWLREQGFAVTGVAHSGMYLAFRGTAGQVKHAFATELHYYTAQRTGVLRTAPAAEPQLPSQLAQNVAGIAGLTTIDAQPAVHARPGYTACYDSTCYHYIAPADFATIYDVPASAGTGSGQTIAIVDRSRVYAPDITDFESQFDLAQGQLVTIVPPEGTDPGAASGTPGQSTDDQTESTLDVERIVGTAPGATADLIVSTDNANGYGIFLDLEYAIDDASTVKAGIISNSFGECEADVAQSDVTMLNTLYQQAAAEGITVLGISGDSGAAECDTYFATPPSQQMLSTNYFCASAYVTCMGGTEFNDTPNPSAYWSTNNGATLGSALSYIPEGAWNEPGSSGSYVAQATGGGVSIYAPTPYWQTGTGVPGTQGRYSPDMAFSASAHDGYYGCYAAGYGNCGDGEYEYFYGTSANAPNMAAITALLAAQQGSTLGNLNPGLYSVANRTTNVFHDATVATSGVSSCSAATPSMCNNSTPSPTSLTGGQPGYLLTTGYDLATGWGSIDVGRFLAEWSANQPVKPSVSFTSSGGASFDTGPVVTVTAKVAASSASASAGTVTLLANGQTVASAAVQNGNAVLQVPTVGLPLGTYSVTASYSGSATLQPAVSPAVSVTLRTSTATTNTTQPVTVSAGQQVTLSATVGSSYGAPGGQLQFFTGTRNITTVNLVNGTATFTASTSGVPTGTYPVGARFLGSAYYDASQSATVNVTVK